jgi:Ser/Thr protein kinase RdoA (MazF antagonist)
MGRQFELRSRTDWLRVGSLLGRLHVAGSCRDAIHRMRLQPSEATTAHIRYLLGQGIISPRYAAEFEDITGAMLDAIDNLFEEAEFIRIHGDCHGGNILKRPGEGLMLIDFDDMMVGPPIQDLWLLLPGRLPDCLFEFDLLLRGYEQFREFDATTGRLIEPLRAMRMIYFLSWCAHQRDDYTFRQNHPQWGTDAFWQRENRDLTTQLQHIRTEWAS